MGTPSFLDLIQPKLKSHLFTIAIDKWGTGTWEFGKIDTTKYIGTLHSVPVDDSCNAGGCWKAADVKAQFGKSTVLPSGCTVFGKLFLLSIFALSSTSLHVELYAFPILSDT